MDALMPALVAGLLAQASDRVAPWLGRQPMALVPALLALALTQGIGAALGQAIAPHLTPSASSLFLALALLSGASIVLWRGKPLRARTGEVAGRVAITVMLAAAMLGDRAAFVTMAVAARTQSGTLAAIGGVIGGAVPLVACAGIGLDTDRLPWRAIRIGVGVIFAIAGLMLGLSALALI